MKAMCLLSNKWYIFFLIVLFLGCEEDDPMPNGAENCIAFCGSYGTKCDEGKCKCDEENYYTFFNIENKKCHPLNDSFYVRVGHEGDISNYEILNTLKMPSEKAMYEFTNVIEDYPRQFVIELMPSNIDQIGDPDFSKPYLPIIVQNENPNNSEFPLSGVADNASMSLNFEGPKQKEDFTYGIKSEWHVSFTKDSAVLKFDVYSAGEEYLILEDEITMYFERYRE